MEELKKIIEEKNKIIQDQRKLLNNYSEMFEMLKELRGKVSEDVINEKNEEYLLTGKRK